MLLDFSQRHTVSLGGITWHLGLIPYGQLVALQYALDDARKPAREVAARIRQESGADTADALQAALAASPEWDAAVRAGAAAVAAAQAEVCRWGVRGWEGCSLPPDKERVAFAGETHEVLPRNVAQALCRVTLPDGRALVSALCDEVLACNAPSLDEIRGF